MKVKEVISKKPDMRKQKESVRTTKASSAEKKHLSENQVEKQTYLLEFLAIVSNTAGEFEYQILLLRDHGFLDKDTSQTLLLQVVDVKRVLEDLANSIGS